MDNPIGMMQGRLSNPPPPRLQVFPYASWEQEFENGRACGFNLIEWLFTEDEGRTYRDNPLWSEGGRARILRLEGETGVRVQTCCAHYFMVHPFVRVTESERLASIRVLEELVRMAARVGIKTILLPVLEACEVRDESEKALLLQSLQAPLDLAYQNGVRLALEMELPAGEYRALVERAHHPALGIYFDTGNLTARGYDIAGDVRLLSPYLFGVHIKDRKRGGSNVFLGQGDTPFESFFRSLREIGYQGPVVLETPIGTDPLMTARSHLAFVKGCLAFPSSLSA
jgi:L-ribulose-5-phosphate 3-epimerase